MSAFETPLVPVNEYDPRTNLKPATNYAVKKGGANTTMNVFPSSSYSNSQINFLPIVPNMETIVSRNALITLYYETVITGSVAVITDMRDAIGILMAPRQNPNGNVINTINTTINNDSLSINLANNISALQKYNTFVDEYLHDLSTFPSMPDFYQNYADGQGANNNPLSDIGTAGYQQGRGGFGTIEIVSSSPTALTVRFYSTEPLYLSPWMVEESHSAGFFGVNNLTMNLVMGDLNRAWSIDTISTNPQITVTTMTTSFYRAPEVLLTFIQPSNVQELPQSIPYSYSNIQEYQTDISTISGGASFTAVSQNIQFTSIPKRVYVYARRSNLTQTYATSDVFARINGVSVNFDVQSGLLSSASELQLYKMSAYNGFQGSWSQWHKYTGSVLAIDFARDICLQNPTETVGVGNVKKNFQITVNFTNLNSNSVAYTLFVVVVSDGLFTLSRGTTNVKQGILSPDDVLNAIDTSRPDAPRPSNFYGGSFLSKGLKFAKAAMKYAPAAIKAAKQVASGNYIGAVQTGINAAKGRGLVGGRMMSKSQLRSRQMMLGSGISSGSNYLEYDDADYQ